MIHIKIVTPEKVVFESEMESATLPTVDGEITILSNHIPLIATIGSGEIVLKKGSEEVNLAVTGGFLELNNNILNILTDNADRAEEIDIKKAEEARQKAIELKKQVSILDEQEYARVASAIERESTRLKVVRKHHTKHHITIE